MGCDIHDFVEVRKNGKWEKVGPIFPYAYNDPKIPSNVLQCYVPERKELGEEAFQDNYHPSHGQPCNEDCYVHNKSHTDNPYDERNYDLFAMLADVRNGHGFAGLDTGNRLNPISEPRGLPLDVTEGVKQNSDRWGCDGHSHSWLLLSELEAYNWDQVVTKRGVVGLRDYQIFKEKGAPEAWCADVAGPKFVSNEKMDQLIMDELLVAEDNGFTSKYMTRIEWKQTYRSRVGEFIEETIPRLRELGAPNDVRLVFWFDN
jgi:hypothetical protein